jgi:hypothetical protein
MTEIDSETETPQSSVFLSYASEDRNVARTLQEALSAYGLDVWFDESGLGGGEAWDQKIRRQIRECDYFMPLVSAQTERRPEGYFRREWRLAVERTLDMADDHLYLLPVVIDDTDQTVARVPDRFLSVQWLKVPGGVPTSAFETLCRRIAAGNGAPVQRVRGVSGKSMNDPHRASTAALSLPFPRQEAGQKVRFWFEVAGWSLRSSWLVFQRVPRWLRVAVYIWLGIVLISHFSSSPSRHTTEVTPAKLEKLKSISRQYQNSQDTPDVAKLGASIAKEFGDDDEEAPTVANPVLAFAFSAATDDAAGRALADSAFAMAYGRLAISHRRQVSLAQTPSSNDLSAAVARGKSANARFVLWGSVDRLGNVPHLMVKLASVSDGASVWSNMYPVEGADPAKIALDVEKHIPPVEPP